MRSPWYEPHLVNIDQAASWFGVSRQRIANYGARYPDVRHGANLYDVWAIAMHIVRVASRRKYFR